MFEVIDREFKWKKSGGKKEPSEEAAWDENEENEDRAPLWPAKTTP